MQDPTLMLFTTSFPYGTGEQFLETEINYLAAGFKRIIIVPSRIDGSPRPTPANVRVEISLSLIRKQSRVERSLAIMKSLINQPRPIIAEALRIPRAVVRPTTLRRLLVWAYGARCTRDWLTDYMCKESLERNNTIFYTYWLEAATLGIGLLKRQFNDLHLVSRAHGYDLYEDRMPGLYRPYADQIFSQLDRLFLVSEHGFHYIISKYPDLSGKSSVSRLGVHASDAHTPVPVASAEKNRLRISSCSFMVRVKRLNLLIEGLAFAAKQRPDITFEWHHLGDGPERERLEAQAKRQLPSNAWASFHGQLANTAVYEFYKNHPIDVFVNTSSSEGLSVSMMEAQSFGIPIIATAVGGTPEIVTAETGLLLPEIPSSAEVGNALLTILEEPGNWREKRKSSLENWAAHFDADRNYRQFVDTLRSLLHSPSNNLKKT